MADTDEKLDPYRPPASDVSAARPANYTGARVYKVGHIGMATFFGSSAAGFVLMALNERTFGRPDESRKTFLTGIVATVLILVAAYFIPESIPALPINLAVVLGVMKYAEYRQSALLADYLENGATLHSGWRAFGISLICILVLMVSIAITVFAMILMNPDAFPD